MILIYFFAKKKDKTRQDKKERITCARGFSASPTNKTKQREKKPSFEFMLYFCFYSREKRKK